MKYLDNKQSGLSLIEILVALVISLFLLGGIIQVYMGNKTTYRFSDASSRIQENGRFALDTMAIDARMADFSGCYGMQPDDNGDGLLADDNPSLNNNLNFVAGGDYDFIDQPPVSATNTPGDWTTPDTLTIRGAEPGQNTFTSTLQTPFTGPVVVSANNTFQTNDIILITNCFSANIFQATSVSADQTTIGHIAGAGTIGNTGNSFETSSPPLPYAANNAVAVSLQAVTYSIAPSASGSGEPALWRSVNGNNQELIEGVENMQILFGEDTDVNADGVANQYRGFDTVANPLRITAIRIWLVVRSDQDFVVDATQPYTINGTTITPGDRRFRQVFSTTIAIRSRTG